MSYLTAVPQPVHYVSESKILWPNECRQIHGQSIPFYFFETFTYASNVLMEIYFPFIVEKEIESHWTSEDNKKVDRIKVSSIFGSASGVNIHCCGGYKTPGYRQSITRLLGDIFLFASNGFCFTQHIIETTAHSIASARLASLAMHFISFEKVNTMMAGHLYIGSIKGDRRAQRWSNKSNTHTHMLTYTTEYETIEIES